MVVKAKPPHETCRGRRPDRKAGLFLLAGLDYQTYHSILWYKVSLWKQLLLDTAGSVCLWHTGTSDVGS